MGSNSQWATAPNITNQSTVPDFINLANSCKGIPSSGGSKTSNKTNNTKNNTKK